MSQLKEYISNPSHIIRLDIVKLKDNLTFNAMLVQIMDMKVKKIERQTNSTRKSHLERSY